jgi:antitoxin CptB
MKADGRRLLWRCRRGLLELDLVLKTFVETHYPTLGPEELRHFDQLLDLTDTELWGLVARDAATLGHGKARLLKMLRELQVVP